MRLPRAILLLSLALPLMGNDCSFVARVGGPPPPPPPPPDGGDPPPASGGGGIIIVTSSERDSSPEAAALRVESPLMAAVLATSVATTTSTNAVEDLAADSGTAMTDVPDGSLRIASRAAALPSGSVSTLESIDSTPRAVASGSAFATPEPNGLVLFLLGFGIVSGGMRRWK